MASISPGQIYQMVTGIGDAFESGYEGARKRRLDDEAPEIVDAYIRSLGGGAGGAAPVPPSMDISSLGGGQPAPGKAPTFAAMQGAEPSMALSDLFSTKEREYALPQGYLTRTAAIESRFDPNAQNPKSSAGGLFQFIDSTAKQYGLENKFDAAASTDAAARLATDNKNVLARALGRDPTPGELYLAHQQGAGGASKLLANPNARAADIVGLEAVVKNGGDPNMSAGQFASLWTSKVDKQADVPAPDAQNAEFRIPGQVGMPAAQGGAVAQPVNGDLLRRMYANPHTRALAQDIIRTRMNPQSAFDFQTVGDQLVRVNKKTGAAEVVPGIVKATNQWSRLNDGTLYNQQTGETRPVEGQTDATMGGYGLQPVYGTDANGNPVIMQLGKGGKAVQTALPEGVKLSKEPIKVDAGTHFVLIDPISRQNVGTIPKDLAGAEAQKVQGKAQGEAVNNLPNSIAQAETTLKTIQDIKNDPAREWATGKSSFLASRMVGTPGYDFTRKVDQLKGQTFLQAFNSLRGGGQITEIEGQKAENAIARLDTAQTEEGFLKALNDLEEVVTAGINRARQRAGVGGPPVASQPSVGRGTTKSGVTWSVD